MENDQFVFDLDAKRIRINDQQMIDSLQTFYSISQKNFTTIGLIT